jgi:hypothetical protein
VADTDVVLCAHHKAGSGCYPRAGGAPKCEHYRCIDLANLRRWGFLRPDSLRAIAFGDEKLEKPDRLWVRANADGAGLLFIKRRPDGELGKIFVSFTRTPTAFNGWRLWFAVPAAGADAVASMARIRCVAANAWGLCTPHKARGLIGALCGVQIASGAASAARPMTWTRSFPTNPSACVRVRTQP